jgi:hypothetical protein
MIGLIIEPAKESVVSEETESEDPRGPILFYRGMIFAMLLVSPFWVGVYYAAKHLF